MIKFKHIIILIIAFFVLISTSCNQAKLTSEEVKVIVPEFKIINAYTQKMIPGQQNQKPYIEFGFEVKGLSNEVKIDSVFCEVGEPIKIEADGKKRLKLLVEPQLIDKLKYEEAIFYYTNKGVEYNYKITNITKKEEVFLP